MDILNKLIKDLMLLVFVCITCSANAAIFFNAKVAGPVTNIYSIDESGNLKKITDNDIWRDLDLSVSASGQLAFISNREEKINSNFQRRSNNYNIFYLKRVGEKLQKLTSQLDHEISPKFSPNEKWIAYLKILNDKQRELYLLKPSAKEKSQLLVVGNISDFSWSPDSKKIVFSWIKKQKSMLSIVDLQQKKIA